MGYGEETVEMSYFPGCSMVTSAKESNLSLLQVMKNLDMNLTELDDWNCCGSSSAHSTDPSLALSLAARNLTLASGRVPLMVMCPSCLIRLKTARAYLSKDPEARERQEELWGGAIDPDLKIMHFFEVMDAVPPERLAASRVKKLDRLRIAAYYGCMLARPPILRKEPRYSGIMERILSRVGAYCVPWRYHSLCCGTFLAAARPDIATPLVNKITEDAVKWGGECIVTACAMCQINLEIRCTLKSRIPVFHFSEILALAMSEDGDSAAGWLKRHLTDPRPLLAEKGLIETH